MKIIAKRMASLPAVDRVPVRFCKKSLTKADIGPKDQASFGVESFAAEKMQPFLAESPDPFPTCRKPISPWNSGSTQTTFLGTILQWGSREKPFCTAFELCKTLPSQ
jgi:hypothetical protein